MTAPHNSLEDKVARVLCGWRNGKPSAIPFEQLSASEKDAYRNQARDALVACEVEEMLAILKRLTAPYAGPESEPMEDIFRDAVALVAKLDGKPAEEGE